MTSRLLYTNSAIKSTGNTVLVCFLRGLIFGRIFVSIKMQGAYFWVSLFLGRLIVGTLKFLKMLS